MKPIWCTIGILLIALLLTYLPKQEGFIGSPDAQRCGVDQPPCPFGTACMNGYCVGTNPPPLPPDTGLPVYPSGKQF
jgi:hypothetical protein